MPDAPEDTDDQAREEWNEQSIGKAILFSRKQSTSVIERPVEFIQQRRSIACGQRMFNAGSWQALPPAEQNCSYVSCFVSSSKSDQISALIIAKRSHSLGDKFVHEDGTLIGEVTQIIRPVLSAPRARIFEDTVVKNYQSTTRIDIDTRNWDARNRLKIGDSDVAISGSSQGAEPQLRDEVLVISTTGQPFKAVVTHVAITERMDDYWFVDLFAVRIIAGASVSAIDSNHYNGLVVRETQGKTKLEPIGMLVPFKSDEILLCARMTRVLSGFDAILGISKESSR